MTTKRTNKERIFSAAAELDADQRNAFLDAACGNDDHLRAEVESLLRHDGHASGLIDRPAVQTPATDLFRPITEGPGTIIGPYKLLQQIGEGGFGVVYMAEQQRPVRRKVALKIIKPGMDTREVIARFESERQALALMDHPNIARVLDAGATDSGRPYFVMELVKGVPITEYCDKNTLPTEKRLELFITICHAVQHAHQKGVIHRDIKPSNVMVTLHDGHPVPKVIDFGVSKATSQQLTEKTLFTAYGQMIGTPAYMSPEQAEMSGLDIDTRSDLYSLGVLLYELLTGTTPFDGKRLREAGYIEMQRIIREEAPPRPSTRVSTLGEALTVLSTQRSTDPKKLGQQLRGDLDVIVMKALEKERSRRYDTPNAFADDIQRFLNHEAIIARPASTAYRLKKFAQRNWAAVAAGFAIATALLAGTSISTWLAIRESHASRLAQSERAKAEKSLIEAVTAKSDAQRERDLAEKAKAEESKQRERAEEQRLAAEAAEKTATTERTAAVQERDKATALNAELHRQKERQRRSLYVAQLNLVRRAWDSNNVSRVRELLNATRPQPGEADLRGFEWHYWMRMLHGSERELLLSTETLIAGPSRFLSGPGGTVSSSRNEAPAAFSHDGKYVATVSRPGQLTLNVWETATGKKVFEKQINGSVASPRGAPPAPGATGASALAIVYVDSTRIAVVLSTSSRSFGSTGFGGPGGGPPGSNRPSVTAAAVLHVFRTDTGEETLSRQAEFFANNCIPFVFSRDGSRFAIPLKEPFIQVCQTDTGEEITRVPIPSREGTARVSEILALSADGTRLAIKPGVRFVLGDQPYGVTIFDLGTDRQVTTPPVHAQHLEFSPDGSRILAVDRNDARTVVPFVTAFDTATGSALVTLAKPAFSEIVNEALDLQTQRLSPDGTWFAITSPMPSGIAAVQLWNTKTGESGPKFQGHSSNPVALGFSPDGQQVSSVHEDGKVLFWKVPSPAEPRLAAASDNVRSGSFGTPFIGNREVVSPDGRWSVFDPSAPEANPAGEPATQRSTSTFGRALLVKDNSGKVADRTLLFSSDQRSNIPRFSPNSAYVMSFGISQEAKLSEAGELKVWEVATGREVIAVRMPAIELQRTFRPGFTPPSGPARGAGATTTPLRTIPIAPTIGFSPDSRLFAVSLPDDTTAMTNPDLTSIRNLDLVIHVWDLTNGRQLLPKAGEVPLRNGMRQLTFSRSGEHLMAVPAASSIRFLLARSLINSRNSPFPGVRTLPEGSSSPRQRGIRLWSISEGKLIFEEPSADLALASADGSRVAGLVMDTAGERERAQIAVWNTQSGQEVSRTSLPSNQLPSGFVFSADGQRMALACGSDVFVYDAGTGQELFQLQGISGDVRGVTFNADCSRVVTSAGSLRLGNASSVLTEEQREVKVWDGFTGQELLSLTGTAYSLIESSFVGDGALQLSAHALSMSDGPTWNAAPLPPEMEAEELAQWVNAPDENGLLPTLEQIAERLKSETIVSDEARRLALQAVRQRRNPAVLLTQADNLLNSQVQARWPFERALSLISEARESLRDEKVASFLEAQAHYRLGDYAVASKALSRTTAASTKLPAEVYAFSALLQHHFGEREKALQALSQAQVVAASNETTWLRWLVEAETALGIPRAADQPEQWIGRRFMTRRSGLATDETGRPTTSYNVPITVTRVEGNRLGFGKYAIERTDVVPLEDAVAYYTSALELNPTNTSLLGNRGIAWRALGEPEKAIEDYTRAIQSNPTNAAPLASRGRVYGYELDEFEKALADFDASLKLQPANAHTLENRGEMLWRIGKIDDALECLDQAIRLDPNRCEAYGVRAQVWSAKGDREKMRQDLDEAIHRHPEDRLAWSLRAWALATSPVAEHRDGPLAVAAATKACELTFWKDAHCLDILAAAHAEAEDFAEAVKRAEQAVSLAHKHKRAKYESRLALYHEGKPYRDTYKAVE